MSRPHLSAFVLGSSILYGCISNTSSPPANSADATATATSSRAWPSEVAETRILSLRRNGGATLTAVTGLLAFDVTGVGMQVSVSEDDGSGTRLVVFVVRHSARKENRISVRPPRSLADYDDSGAVIGWRGRMVEAGSSLESELIELVSSLVQTCNEPAAKYNAGELLAVLNDRQHECSWRQFHYGREDYGEGYGARYREKYGDESK